MVTDTVNTEDETAEPHVEKPADETGNWWAEGEDAPLPPEPPVEYTPIDDDVLPGEGSFAICEHCGAIVSNDPADLARHINSHKADVPRSPGITRTGEDLAALIRETMKAALRERKLTQADFCRQVGVSQKHMSQMMSGAANGSLELWSKYASALDLQWSVTLEQQ